MRKIAYIARENGVARTLAMTMALAEETKRLHPNWTIETIYADTKPPLGAGQVREEAEIAKLNKERGVGKRKMTDAERKAHRIA